MDWIGAAFAVAFISFVLWACTGTFVSALLRDHFPDIYAEAGMPRVADFWWFSKLPTAFDRFTMTRRFRGLTIANSDVLWQLELACWLRWLHVAAVIAFLVLLLASVFRQSAP